MLYFAYVSNVFKKSSLNELSGIFPDMDILKDYREIVIFNSKKRFSVGDFNKESPIFTYNIIRLNEKKDVSTGNYLDDIYKTAYSLKPRKKSRIRIECFDLNSRCGYSSKDIEVYIGEKLESDGYCMDIMNPDTLLYLVIIDMTCFAGCARRNEIVRESANPRRRYARKISRAEWKLQEAFEEFHIPNGNLAIDVGASPGGWSAVLVNKGFRVIAIDPADFDESIVSSDAIAYHAARGKICEVDKMNNDIIHLKEKLTSAVKKMDGIIADMIAIDINSPGKDAAEAAIMYSKYLKKDGALLITIKCQTKFVKSHIETAKKLLSKKFKIKGVRVLPANRQEVTIFGVKI